MASRLRIGALASLVALAATAVGGVPAAAADPVPTIDAGLTRINLLNITDFHGRIDDKGALACAIETAKATLGEDRTILVATGDNIGATPFVSSSQADQPTIEYLNALQLATSAVGNHELDRGFADLTGRVASLADFSYTAANLYQRGTTTPAVDAYDVVVVNGVRVGIIGAITQETASLVSPAGITGVDFGDPVAAVNRVADLLTDGDSANGEADVLVAQYHDGGANRSTIVERTSAKVAVITLGHTHEVYVGTGDRAVIQSANYGTALGTVQVGYDPATGTVKQYSATVAEKLPAASGACLTDPQYVAARQIADAAIAQAKVIGARPIGTITADITTAYQDATLVGDAYTGTKRDDRGRESTLGDLTAQAWLAAMNVPGRGGADIGIMNPGGLRAELFYKADPATPGDADGVVTLAEAASVNPFANTLQTIDITGAQVKTLLEQQWQPAGSSRPFLALGLSDNLRYTYDPARAAGDRVTSILLDDEPIDPAETYTVASSSFLIAGGDNFTVLQSGSNVKDSGLIDTDAFMNHFSAQGQVSPDFRTHGVAVTKASATPQFVTVRMEGFDLTSLGSPANRWFRVYVDDRNTGTREATSTVVATPVPVRAGVWEYRIPFTGKPRAVGSEHVVRLVSQQTGTTVTVPVTVAKG